MEKWKLTINDVLSRELFKKARIVAGESGMNREVKWTHILELGDIESFINGGELILTTGSGIKFDSPKGIIDIEKLLKKDIAGICIELGTHVKKVSPEIIHFCNKHQLPLIVFDEIVKFVDITQDLHTNIINHHHQMLSQLYTFSETINKLSLLPNGILKILKELYNHFQTAVLFISDDTRSYYYPPTSKDYTQTLKEWIRQSTKLNSFNSCFLNGESYTIFPIKGLGNMWGYLCIQDDTENLDEFSFSIADRAALAIAQIMLRNKTMEERKQNQEEEIVRNLLQGKKYDLSDIQKILPAPAKNLYYRLFLIDKHTHNVCMKEGAWEEMKLQQSIIIRTLFRKNGFVPAVSVGRNEIAVIAASYMQDDAKKDTNRFLEIVRELKTMNQNKILHGEKCSFGISNVHHDYSSSSCSYKEAKNVIFIQNANLIQTYFYEEMGVFRILLDMHHNNQLESYVQDYLAPILRHDKEMKSELLKTLSVYLNCMGSKKETASRLFIVRQTLYHRLDKIEDLLKTDLMEPTNRQAIELALNAYYLLKRSSQKPDFTNYWDKEFEVLP
ncbi:PucR family transcriptional regulator [Oceanobacillus salinisoli]|uniref:PucR family transcriptional regulator n=1 Tax=Oceanobacillus salinisoli TaxID=2678611 RepID=UPI0012E1F853|nr:PucR family transcriptional regulator [Oceanobacillus salinisoli]